MTVCACIFFLSMREESRSCVDKIELGDELVSILVDSFVEMCQEVPRAKTAREQFLPPVARTELDSNQIQWATAKTDLA